MRAWFAALAVVLASAHHAEAKQIRLTVSSIILPRDDDMGINGQAQRVCLLAYDAGRQYDPGAAFEIKPQLLDAAGSPVSSGGFHLSKAVAGEDGFRRFVLDFTPTALLPGDYRLRVRFRDPSSGRVSESYQTVRVE